MQNSGLMKYLSLSVQELEFGSLVWTSLDKVGLELKSVSSQSLRPYFQERLNWTLTQMSWSRLVRENTDLYSSLRWTQLL